MYILLDLVKIWEIVLVSFIQRALQYGGSTLSKFALRCPVIVASVELWNLTCIVHLIITSSYRKLVAICFCFNLLLVHM